MQIGTRMIGTEAKNIAKVILLFIRCIYKFILISNFIKNLQKYLAEFIFVAVVISFYLG